MIRDILIKIDPDQLREFAAMGASFRVEAKIQGIDIRPQLEGFRLDYFLKDLRSSLVVHLFENKSLYLWDKRDPDCKENLSGLTAREILNKFFPKEGEK